jgi:exodeoxyribonuclease V alpha subunit
MPLLTQHFIMLQRNLFYTALTRAKKLSVIVGSYKALHIAIKNDKPVKRNSLVKEKLMLVGV